MAVQQPSPLLRFYNGILPENPVFRQVLGICPLMAITTSVKAAITMAVAVAFTLVYSNLFISLLRPVLKPHMRLLVFTLNTATFVSIVDRLLMIFMPDMSTALGPYVPLIMIHCVIIARAEICASKQGLVAAFSDAVGQSLGNGIALVFMASVRELLGAGSWFGIPILPASVWDPWVAMLLPPGAFFVLGLSLAVVNFITQKRKAFKKIEKSAAAPVS